MEQSFADLLDASLPSFSDGELDFETLHLNERFEGAETNRSKENKTDEEEVPHKEETDQTTTLSNALTTINTNMAENDEEEAASKMYEVSTGTGVCTMHTDNIPEGQYYSSDEDFEQGYSECSRDKEDTGLGNKLKGLSVAVHCSNESLDDNNQDGTITEGQPSAPDGSANPQVRNKDQGESDSDEGQFYIGKVPMRGSGLKKIGERTEEGERPEVEEKLQDGSDTESEGKKVTNDDEGKEVNEDVIIDKMKDFSGDDHQEAGETFADYPSDFSCEYMEYGGYNEESRLHVLPYNSESGLSKNERSYLGQSLPEITSVQSAERKDQDLEPGWTGINSDLAFGMALGLPAGEMDNVGGTEGVKCVLGDKSLTENNTGDGISAPNCLKTKDGIYTEEQTGPNQTTKTTSLTSGETFTCGSQQHQHNSENYSIMGHRLLSDCDSYSSGDDDVQVMKGYEENTIVEYSCDSKNYNQPKDDAQLQLESTATLVSDATDAESLNISLDTVTSTLEDFEVLSNREADEEEILPWSPVICSQDELKDDDTHTTMHSPNQGSVDDGFFFNDEYEALRITEPGEFRDDEYEEERNWEQEQERIKAFYNFYNDSEGANSTGRKIKVQFCSETLSQVIHYDSDSSGRESPDDSSTDGEEDLSSGETATELMESEASTMSNVPFPPHNPLPENVQNLNRTAEFLGILKLILKMGLVVLMGLLMFWWANNQEDWLS